MFYFRAREVIEVEIGSILTLETEQARRRGAKLTALGDGRYRAAAIVQFKKGEMFGLEADPRKALLPLLEAVDRPLATDASAISNMDAPSAGKRKRGIIEKAKDGATRLFS